MDKIISLSFIVGLILASCTEPNIIGLEVQPDTDKIIINDTSSFSWQESQTDIQDSINTTKLLNFILGEIYDPEFGYNQGSFYTQILLSENNTLLGENPIVDSVILSYTYSGYYGDFAQFANLESTPSILEVNRIYEDLFEDSSYYSNSFEIVSEQDSNLTEMFSLSNNPDESFIKIKLDNNFGQRILNRGDEDLKDNETFLQHFKGISVMASTTNTMLYLNPNGSNSYLKIYYHNNESATDTLSLDFQMGGDAVNVNLFNKKKDNPEHNIIINDQSKIYIQSMSSYKSRISIMNIDSIKDLLQGLAINKVTMSFDVESGSQSDEYNAHDRLFLVRIDENGNNVFLIDQTIEGETHFGGYLQNNKYEFNITRYFYQLLNNSTYTNELYLLPAGNAVNANRTIIEKDIVLTIYYSDLL